MTEYIKIIIPLITALGGWEVVKYLINRKSNKRKVSAEAESLELNNQQDEVERLEERLKVRDAKIDKIWIKMKFGWGKQSFPLNFDGTFLKVSLRRKSKYWNAPTD